VPKEGGETGFLATSPLVPKALGRATPKVQGDGEHVSQASWTHEGTALANIDLATTIKKQNVLHMDATPPKSKQGYTQTHKTMARRDNAFTEQI
jgi:hypothetical protein